MSKDPRYHVRRRGGSNWCRSGSPLSVTSVVDLPQGTRACVMCLRAMKKPIDFDPRPLILTKPAAHGNQGAQGDIK